MDRNPVLLYKTLVVGIIILLFGMSVVSSTNKIIEDIPSYIQILDTKDSSEELFRGNYGYAYFAYPGPESTVYFSLDDPDVIYECGDSESGDFLTGGTIDSEGLWYSIEYGNGILWGIDTNNYCDMWSIGGGGGGELAWDDETALLYSISGYNLEWYDPDTGEGGYLGNIDVLLSQIEFDNNGILYGFDFTELYYVYTIDLSTLEATLVGTLTNITSTLGGFSVAFDKDTNNLYILGNGPYLYICDIETYECTLILGYEGSAELTSFVIPYNGLPPNKVYVDDDFNESTPGWGYDHFDMIQDGVDAVEESGTVYVYNGTYYENIVVDKSINLVGEDKENTIIDGNYNHNVVYVSNVNSLTIEGFTIRNTNPDVHYGAVQLDYCNNCTINNNKFSSCEDAGVLLNYASYNIIANNNFFAVDDGIELVWSSCNNIISDNFLTNIYDCGMWIKHNCEGNIIKNNTFKNVQFEAICVRYPSSNNLFYHNNFINCNPNALVEDNNIWNDSYPSGGNYWDDYTGNDSDGDGIGDIPYLILFNYSDKDELPLIRPWGENLPVANFTYNNIEFPVMFDASSSYDRDGKIISYRWDFGDGKTGIGEIVYHTYCDVGTYDVTLNVTDDNGFTGNITKSVDVPIADIPPEIEIYGPNRGKPGIEYDYVFYLIDPDPDDFYLWVDWGNGDSTGWMGPYLNGSSVKHSHMWNETGIYVIKAKVKDDCGESEWAEFEIEIPRTRASLYLWFGWLLERFPLLERLLGWI